MPVRPCSRRSGAAIFRPLLVVSLICLATTAAWAQGPNASAMQTPPGQQGQDPSQQNAPQVDAPRVDAPVASNSDAPMHFALELTSSFNSRPERSQGGTDLLFELGLRASVLQQLFADTGWTLGGELALRTLTPETEGSSFVKSELYRFSTHAAGLFGYQFNTVHAGFFPHLSTGLSNDFVLVRLVSPGNETLRPRWLPGLFVGAGVMVNFLAFLLRGDVSLGYSDGRPEYRWNLGMGARF